MLLSKAKNVLQFAVHSYILMTKEAIHLATRTANVMARVEPDVKEQAENILDRLGVPASVVINALYKQIIYRNGIPFSLPTAHQVSPRGAQMVVTPREIDLLIDRAASLVSMAINISLNPTLDAEIFAELI